jgi:hypothetical protein
VKNTSSQHGMPRRKRFEWGFLRLEEDRFYKNLAVTYRASIPCSDGIGPPANATCFLATFQPISKTTTQQFETLSYDEAGGLPGAGLCKNFSRPPTSNSFLGKGTRLVPKNR